MTEMLFCYCCRVHHAKEKMRLFPTRYGNRWRCVRSIEAAGRKTDERDAFGREQTTRNREASQRAAQHSQRLRDLVQS